MLRARGGQEATPPSRPNNLTSSHSQTGDPALTTWAVETVSSLTSYPQSVSITAWKEEFPEVALQGTRPALASSSSEEAL